MPAPDASKSSPIPNAPAAPVADAFHQPPSTFRALQLAMICFALSAVGLAVGLAGLELEQKAMIYGGFTLLIVAGLAAHVLAIWGWFRLPKSASGNAEPLR